MISIQEADEKIRCYFGLQKESIIPIEDARGKTLAQKIFAKRDIPPFHRVAMDGIAINSVMTLKYNNDLIFTIEGIQAAGQPQKLLDDTHNGCLEAMTGAILPKNADMVIPYEKVEIKNGKAIYIESVEDLANEIKAFKNIHKQGSEVSSNEVILQPGQKITSAVVAIIASEGIPFIKVKNSPKIAIVSTGSELIGIHQVPKEHQIHMSNTYAITSELNAFGYKEIECHHIPDNQKTLFEKMHDILSQNQLVILTGGVSKGRFDYVPKVLSELKIKKIFHKVRQRPGKPLWFGQGEDGQLVFGLPGNPVSALVNLRRHVIPCLTSESYIKIKLKEDLIFEREMTLFQPVKLEYIIGAYFATPIKGNGSGDYLSLKESDGFLQLPAEKNEFKKNEIYPFYPWGKSCL